MGDGTVEGDVMPVEAQRIEVEVEAESLTRAVFVAAFTGTAAAVALIAFILYLAS